MINSIFQMGKRLSKLTRVTLLGDLSPGGWLHAESCPNPMVVSYALGAPFGGVLSRIGDPGGQGGF